MCVEDDENDNLYYVKMLVLVLFVGHHHLVTSYKSIYQFSG